MSADPLAAIVRGDSIVPLEAWLLDPALFWDAAERHGLTPLVASRLRARDDAPRGIRDRALEIERAEAVRDVLSEAALRRVLSALADAEVGVLLMKGALLAHQYYERPELRRRLDTDILVQSTARDAVHRVLTGLGYRPDVQATQDIGSHQRPYLTRLHGTVDHVIDVHWRLANPALFGHVLAFDELSAASVAVPSLGGSARGLSPVHSLLVACVHRVAHHLDDERLIWVYDIHLIAGRLSTGEWDEFAKIATERRVAAICHAGLRRSMTRFGTAVPEHVLEATASAAAETTAAYMSRRHTRAGALVYDLRTLESWSDRWRLMRDYAFPPIEYMRQVYSPSSAAPLPWLYARRVLAGVRKWLAPPRSIRHRLREPS